MAEDRTIEELIAASSLGSRDAVRQRRLTPRSVKAQILALSDALEASQTKDAHMMTHDNVLTSGFQGKRLDDDLLFRIVEKLQLAAAQHRRATKHYLEVATYLASPGSPLAQWQPDLYPQGSMAMGTTVRPLRAQEFDLDLVLELVVDAILIDPVRLLDVVFNYLSCDERYRSIAERKDRCIRLTFAGDFHLDVVPACRDASRAPTGILVPDRKARGWKASNPRGLLTWFEGVRVPRVRTDSVEMNKSASIAPPPPHVGADEKVPLQLVIQLLKRNRDLRFEHSSDLATPSILITVLAGQFYQGEASVSATLRSVVSGFSRYCGQHAIAPTVLNPADSSEVISEKWRDNPASWIAFREWIRVVDASLQRDASSIELTKAIVGPDALRDGLLHQAEAVKAASANGTLRAASTGALSTVAPRSGRPASPRHHFYGDE